MMGNIDDMIEHGWSRRTNNIINSCNYIFNEFLKRKHSLKLDVFGKMGRIFYISYILVIIGGI